MQTVDVGGLPIGDGHPPRIMGVLNVSEDSPYDPSVFSDVDEAVRYVEDHLIGEGADIVDIGLETANRRFDVLPVDAELDRLQTAIAVKDAVSGDAVFSLETRYHEVADVALEAGFDMINDICGFADPELPTVCERHGAAVVKMAGPSDLERPGAVDDVDDIYEALRRGGFTEKTLVDPAFGGWSQTKTLTDDREIFHRLREFRALDRPILVSINRKNFLKDIVDRETDAALPVSLGATAMAVERGAHVVRTHDVAETRDAALVGAAFARDRVRTDRVEELDVTTVREARRHVDRHADGAPLETVAAESVARVFRLDTREASRDTLAEVAAEVGDVVTAASGGDRIYLAGTVAGLRRYLTALERREGEFDGIVAGVERAL